MKLALVLNRGVYSYRVSRALPPPRSKLLGCCPVFYINGKGNFCPKTGQFLPCFVILL